MKIKYGTGKSSRANILNKTQSKIFFPTLDNKGKLQDSKGRVIGAQITKYEVMHKEYEEGDSRAYYSFPAGYYYAFIPHNTRDGECFGAGQDERLYTTGEERDREIEAYLRKAHERYINQMIKRVKEKN